MRGFVAFVNRLLILLISLLLLFVGVVTILWWHHMWRTRELVGDIDRNSIAQSTQQWWYALILLAVFLLSLLIGVGLIKGNSRPSRLGPVRFPRFKDGGVLTLSPNDVGKAAAKELEKSSYISRASAKSVVDGGAKLLRITVEANPHTPIPVLRDLFAATADDVNAALVGSGITPQFMLEYEPVKD